MNDYEGNALNCIAEYELWRPLTKMVNKQADVLQPDTFLKHARRQHFIIRPEVQSILQHTHPRKIHGMRKREHSIKFSFLIDTDSIDFNIRIDMMVPPNMNKITETNPSSDMIWLIGEVNHRIWNRVQS